MKTSPSCGFRLVEQKLRLSNLALGLITVLTRTRLLFLIRSGNPNARRRAALGQQCWEVTTAALNPPEWCKNTGEIYFGSDGPSQQSVNPFGKGWDVTEAHLDVKIKFKHPLKLKPQEFL